LGLLLLLGFLFGGGGVVEIVVAVAIELFSTLEIVGLFVPAPEPGEVGLLLLGICFLRGVPEDVVVEIGEGEKGECGRKRDELIGE
jgi:hypothetical protein